MPVLVAGDQRLVGVVGDLRRPSPSAGTVNSSERLRPTPRPGCSIHVERVVVSAGGLVGRRAAVGRDGGARRVAGASPSATPRSGGSARSPDGAWSLLSACRCGWPVGVGGRGRLAGLAALGAAGCLGRLAVGAALGLGGVGGVGCALGGRAGAALPATSRNRSWAWRLTVSTRSLAALAGDLDDDVAVALGGDLGLGDAASR